MPERIKKIGRFSLPYLVILLVALFIMANQIKSHAFIPGVDAFFHMNRFYDTAMQIKTGHYSYFASIFGFNQTGRIVNALYGPLIAYINGGFLLLAGTWFRFQILSSFLVLIIGGSTMYHLCRINRVKIMFALPIGLLYMISTPIMLWVLDQQFTGWGAALMPIIIMAGSHMVNYRQIKVVPLALAVTVLLQTHLMSTLIGVAALVPLFIISWFRSKHKKQMVINLFAAVVLTLALTGNVWGAMLEVFRNNNLIPVFPQTNMILNAVGVNPNRTIDRLGVVFTITFIMVIVVLLAFWKKVSPEIKTFAFSGLFLLWISSRLFPWDWLAGKIPSITYTIQMPKRFVVVAVILLLLTLGMILSDSPLKVNNANLDLGAKLSLLMVLFVSGWLNVDQQFNKRISNYYSQQVVSQPIWLLHYHSDDADQIRQAYHSQNLVTGLNIITKATPDYLPTNQPVTVDNYPDLHPYRLTNSQLIEPKRIVTKYINQQGNLVVKWKNNKSHSELNSIPVVKYYHTELILNGRVVQPKKLTKIGKVQVMAKPGVNRLEIKYLPSRYFTILMWMTILTWLGLLLSLLFNHRIMEKLNVGKK